MNDFISILSHPAWGSDSAAAAAIGVTVQQLRKWRARGSIPGAYFRAVVGAARSAGVPGVTPELLVDLAALKRTKAASGSDATHSDKAPNGANADGTSQTQTSSEI